MVSPEGTITGLSRVENCSGEQTMEILRRLGTTQCEAVRMQYTTATGVETPGDMLLKVKN